MVLRVEIMPSKTRIFDVVLALLRLFAKKKREGKMCKLVPIPLICAYVGFALRSCIYAFSLAPVKPNNYPRRTHERVVCDKSQSK